MDKLHDIQQSINKWELELAGARKERSDLSINVEIYEFHMSQLDERDEGYQNTKEYYEKLREQSLKAMHKHQKTIKFFESKIEGLKEEREAERLARQQAAEELKKQLEDEVAEDE